MKESNSLVISAMNNYLHNQIWSNTKGEYMKESNTVTGNETIKQIERDILMNIKGVKYSCVQCGKQLTSQSNLAKHKRAVHEGVKYFCRQCDHQASSKSNLAKHQSSVHEGIKSAMENQD